MCSINHDLRSIYIHIPKNGGTYINKILKFCYDFKVTKLTRKDHNDFNENIDLKYTKNFNCSSCKGIDCSSCSWLLLF